jgi:hypothetical protein
VTWVSCPGRHLPWHESVACLRLCAAVAIISPPLRAKRNAHGLDRRHRSPTSACRTPASIMMEQSRHRSVETLRGYVRGPRCGNRQGEEATRRLKGNPQTREIPIAGERDKALAAGCDEFDTPIDFDRLVATVRRPQGLHQCYAIIAEAARQRPISIWITTGRVTTVPTSTTPARINASMRRANQGLWMTSGGPPQVRIT